MRSIDKSKILVGYEANFAEEARVPIFHMILTGITQHGKTEELKRLVTEAQHLGYTVLILDVKDKPQGEKGDFEGFGIEIPIYLAGIADTLSIYGLLESHSELSLRRELPELARACKRGKTLRGAYEILKQMQKEDKVHPITKDRIEILILVLEGLIAEMDKAKPSSKLKLKKGKINVMKLRGWSKGFKQLAVNDATAYIRKHYKKIIEVFDEAHQQIPQAYGSGSKRTVTSAIKEGAGSEQYIWVADQTIKEIDKDVIAQIPIKIYGGQPGAKLRAKETLDHLPVKTWRDRKINEAFIMQLKTGFFILGERDRTRLVYTLPLWMPAPLGRLVAEGKCSPETAKEICSGIPGREITKIVDISSQHLAELRRQIEKEKNVEIEKRDLEIKTLKTKLEKLKVDYQEGFKAVPEEQKKLEKKLEDLEEWKRKHGGKFQEDKERIERLEEEKKQVERETDRKVQEAYRKAMKKVDEIKSQWNIDELQKTIMVLKDENAGLKQSIQKLHKSYDKKSVELLAAERPLEKLREAFSLIVPTPKIEETAILPKLLIPSEISVTTEQPMLHVKRERTPLNLKQKDIQGRIAIVYAEGLLPSNKAFTLRYLNQVMEQRFGRKEAYANFGKVLVDLVAWGFFEKVKAGKRWDYRLKMKPEEAKAKGLLKVEEK